MLAEEDLSWPRHHRCCHEGSSVHHTITCTPAITAYQSTNTFTQQTPSLSLLYAPLDKHVLPLITPHRGEANVHQIRQQLTPRKPCGTRFLARNAGHTESGIFFSSSLGTALLELYTQKQRPTLDAACFTVHYILMHSLLGCQQQWTSIVFWKRLLIPYSQPLRQGKEM